MPPLAGVPVDPACLECWNAARQAGPSVLKASVLPPVLPPQKLPEEAARRRGSDEHVKLFIPALFTVVEKQKNTQIQKKGLAKEIMGILLGGHQKRPLKVNFCNTEKGS